MNLSRFATQHIKAILFVTVVLCAIGAWLVGSFPVAILPEVDLPAARGDRGGRRSAGADDGRRRHPPIEEAVATVPGVTRIRSKTQRGATEISIDFAWGTDMLTTLPVGQRPR